MKKRVLIGYAECGSGHKSASEYIKKYFDEFNKYEVMVINLSDYYEYASKMGSKFIKHTIKSEFLYNIFYGLFNNKLASKGNYKLCIKSFDSKELRDDISRFNPDIVISTHFYFSYMTAFYNKEKVINSKIITVITDLLHHDWWTINHKDIDYFVVSNDIVKNKLSKSNIPDDKILSYGVPIHMESLINLDDKDFVLKKYSLTGNKPIYLFFSDGSDISLEYLKTILKKKLLIDIIFITGKNKSLKLRCENYLIKYNIKNVLVLGQTKDVYNLINISNLVITKPTLNTLNDCMFMKKPCILLPGVSVQDNYNSKYMTKNHYAVKVRGPKGLARKIKISLTYPFIIKSMINKLNKIDTKDSCKKIYELTNKILKEK